MFAFVDTTWGQEPSSSATARQRIQNPRAGSQLLEPKSNACNNKNTSSSSSLSFEVSMDMIAVGPALNTNGKPRARRGSATDPQSIYARVSSKKSSWSEYPHETASSEAPGGQEHLLLENLRLEISCVIYTNEIFVTMRVQHRRNKINERLKTLQHLVPNGAKVQQLISCSSTLITSCCCLRVHQEPNFFLSLQTICRTNSFVYAHILVNQLWGEPVSWYPALDLLEIVSNILMILISKQPQSISIFFLG
jgi:hypothetical protein